MLRAASGSGGSLAEPPTTKATVAAFQGAVISAAEGDECVSFQCALCMTSGVGTTDCMWCKRVACLRLW